MIDWHPHKLWIVLLAAAVTIGIGHSTALSLAQEKAEKRLTSLRVEEEKNVKALRQLEADIAEAERMKSEMDISDAETYLAPTDRLRTAQLLERLAAESRLTHITYTLSPEQKTSVETLTGGAQELATSRWTLAADAPTDIDVYAFLDDIARKVQGRMTVSEMSLDRIGERNTPIGGANIRLTAGGDWLSNGAVRNPAQELP